MAIWERLALRRKEQFHCSSRNFSHAVKKEGPKVEAAAVGRAIATHLKN